VSERDRNMIETLREGNRNLRADLAAAQAELRELRLLRDRVNAAMPDAWGEDLGAAVEELALRYRALETDLAAAQQRIEQLEESLSVRVAVDDTNRTLAEDWKQMRRAARAAEKDGYYIEWLSEYGESFSLLQANIMDRLTRLPLPQPPSD